MKIKIWVLFRTEFYDRNSFVAAYSSLEDGLASPLARVKNPPVLNESPWLTAGNVENPTTWFRHDYETDVSGYLLKEVEVDFTDQIPNEF